MQNNDKNAAVIRVMLAKIGLDGHDRGIKVVARALRDAGMDVVYTGLHRTPEEVTAKKQRKTYKEKIKKTAYPFHQGSSRERKETEKKG